MRSRFRHIATAGLLLIAILHGRAAMTMEPVDADAVIVDAAIREDGSVIEAVTANPPSLILIRASDGVVVSAVPLPHTPGAIVSGAAFSHSAILFPYNDAVGLLDHATSEVTIVDVGENPTDLAVRLDGGFATTDSFSNSVSLLSESGARSPIEVQTFPVRVATTSEYLVVTTRSPKALLVFSANASRLIQRQNLDEVPGEIIGWTRNRVLLVYRDRTDMYDAASNTVSTLSDGLAEISVGRDGRVYAMRGSQLSVYDESGSLEREEDLGISGKPVPVAADRVGVLETRSGKLYLPEASVLIELTQQLTPEPQPEPTPEPAPEEISETAPDTIDLPDLSAESLVITREFVLPPTAPEYNTEAIRGYTLEREKTASVTGKSKYSVRPGRTRLGGNRPHAPFLYEQRPVTIDQAIRRSTAFRPGQNSLFNIDVTQEPEIENSEHLNSVDNRTTLTEDVRLRIDGALIETDHAVQDDEAGTLLLDGNVRASKEDSLLTTDKLSLRRHPPTDEPLPPTPEYPLVPFGYDITLDDPLDQGAIEAFNVHVKEVDREFDADYLFYDSFDETGEIVNPHGHSGPFYFSADRIRILGPDRYDSDDLWITTCDLEDPHYRIRLSRAEFANGELVNGRNMRLQIGKTDTPLYIPRLSGVRSDGSGVATVDLKAGSRSELGAYVNFAQWYEVNDNIDAAYRLFPTTKEGLGYGANVEYDYMEDPSSLFFRSRGSLDTLYTTQDRGYTHWYHRQSLGSRTRLLAQWEQWYDREFYKDFYNEEYEDRSGPRTFTNITHLRPGVIATASVSKSTHDFVSETEKLPEGSVHVLERPLAKNLYLSMDTVAGNYRRNPSDFEARRLSHIARLSYDWNIMDGLNILPFVEGGATYYSETLQDDDADTRWIGLVGTTAQARFSRTLGGLGRFSAFKHIIIPSVTYFEQDSSSLRENEVPRFDAIDAVPTRRRVESKVDNVLLGRNEADGETWRVARLALYQGHDFSNDAQEATDYEADMEIRPRPWWGFRAIGEHHELDEKLNIPGKDRDRVLSYLFYDDRNFENSFNARLGYALTEVDGVRLNREILYGAGYKLSPAWSVSAEHRYDLETDSVDRQTYEIRRRLHKWEMALRLRDRPSSTDINIVFSLTDIAGTAIRF